MLNVLDGAVLVISAVEGVQPQTRILARTLRRLNLPALIFVNKIDRAGAHPDRLVRDISEKLGATVIPMGRPHDLGGGRDAAFARFGEADEGFVEALGEALAEHDDALLAAYVDDSSALSYERLRRALVTQSRRALVHPVYFGSATTGAGVDALIDGLRELLPVARGAADGPVSGTVFKVERTPGGQKVAYVRMFSGIVRARSRLMFGQGREGRVTGIEVFDRGTSLQRQAVTAGQIAKLWGLGDIRIGDAIGGSHEAADQHYFAPPTLETVVVPRASRQNGELHAALTQLAEQDPLINVRQDDSRQEISVSLYGEVQKEVIQATLADEFGLDVSFRESTMICIERPVGSGAAVEFKRTEPNPFLATIGLRIDPGPIDSGVEFRLEVELGSMPYAFFRAVEDTVYETLQQGLHGWNVTDCVVTMTHSGYLPRQRYPRFDKSQSSTGYDFRGLTPLVLMNALQQARTIVYEPMHRFGLELPTDTLGTVLPVLTGLRAVPHTPEIRDPGCVLEGDIPAAGVHELQQQLPKLTRGEGVLESGFDHYQPVRGIVSSRPRADHNPLVRKEYLLHVVRRV